jgi:hypothetical protein
VELLPEGGAITVDDPAFDTSDGQALSICGRNLEQARVYRWTPSRSGTATLDLEILHGNMVAVAAIADAQLCTGPFLGDASLACGNALSGDPGHATVPVVEGVSYFIVLGKIYSEAPAPGQDPASAQLLLGIQP